MAFGTSTIANSEGRANAAHSAREYRDDLSNDLSSAWLQPQALGARRLERILRLRHQHPRQPAHADRSAPLRAADAGGSGLQAHPPGRRPHDVHEHHVLRVARLSPGEKDREKRRLRAAFGHQRAAHVHRHAGDHAAGQAGDGRPDQGLAGRSDVGLHPEFRADGRRVSRPDRAGASRRRRPCSARSPASRSRSSR